MSEEPAEPLPESTPSSAPTRRAATGFAGETTGGMAGLPATPWAAGGPADSAPLREVIGDFEVLGKLGQGGMGAVYRARQVSLDREVALKILPPALAADPQFVARFQREARIAANLHHANLVRVYASGEADGCHYIAMEFVEGETLGQWLKRGALPPPEALRITLDVAQALECGWRTAQLIHRDIKPGNIFLSVHGEVKLGDLGLAKTLGSDSTGLTQTGAAMGTPHYISPEQARGDADLDYRADIYSLGCTLYHMLTGRTPYEGRDPVAVFHQHIHASPPAILKVLPQCPIPVARLVAKMLKKHRRERFGSYEELIAEIERAAAPFAPAPSALEEHERSPHPEAARRHPLAAGQAPSARPKSRLARSSGFAVAVIVLAVASVFFLLPKEEKLTKAQLYAARKAAEERARPAQSTNAEVGKNASATEVRPTPRWEPLLTAEEWRTPDGKGREFRDGMVHLRESGLTRPQPSPDGAIRARIRIQEGSKNPQIFLRSVSGVSRYHLNLAPGKTVQLVRYAYASDATSVKKGKFELPQHPGQAIRCCWSCASKPTD